MFCLSKIVNIDSFFVENLMWNFVKKFLNKNSFICSVINWKHYFPCDVSRGEGVSKNMILWYVIIVRPQNGWMFVVPELALQLLQGRGGDCGGLEVVHAVRLLQGEVVTLHKQHSLTLHATLPSLHYWLLFTWKQTYTKLKLLYFYLIFKYIIAWVAFFLLTVLAK